MFIAITIYEIFGKPCEPEADMDLGELPEWIEPCDGTGIWSREYPPMGTWSLEYPPMGENGYRAAVEAQEDTQPVATIAGGGE